MSAEFYIIIHNGVPVDCTTSYKNAVTRRDQWSVPGREAEIVPVISIEEPETEEIKPGEASLQTELALGLEYLDPRHGGYNER